MYNVEIITIRRFPFSRFPECKQVSPRKYVARSLSKEDAKRIVRRARLRLYNAYYYDEKWERGKGYKKKWILKNPQDKYRCVYCGRKVPYNSITLDHIFPVSVAKKSRIARFWLKYKGCQNIDDDKNLVPACHNCNKLKGKSTSPFWQLRAFLGRYTVYWIIMYFLFGVFVLGLISLLYGALRGNV